MNYEVQRDIFNQILKKYLAYLDLYKLINNGQIEGVSTFQNFYWRFTYYSKYENPAEIPTLGN